jgi:hypothetical protein
MQCSLFHYAKLPRFLPQCGFFATRDDAGRKRGGIIGINATDSRPVGPEACGQPALLPGACEKISWVNMGKQIA